MMSLKIILFSVILFVLLLDLSTAAPGDLDQSEEERRANGQRELFNNLENLEKYREREEKLRKLEPLPQNEDTKKQRLKDQEDLDCLELNVRCLIDNILMTFDTKEPLNEEYMQKVSKLNKDLTEYNALITKIEENRVKERREEDLRKLEILEQQLNQQVEYEQSIIPLEYIPDGEIAKQQRVTEKKSLISAKENLERNIEILKNYHNESLSLNETYNSVIDELRKSIIQFDSITNQILQRRTKEKISEIEKLEKLKKNSISLQHLEIDQQLQDEPPTDDILLKQRKEEIKLQRSLYRYIQHRTIELESKIVQKNYIEKSYDRQKKLLLQKWQNFKAVIEKAQQRRTQELNVQACKPVTGGDEPGPSGENY